jgi:hypothetical protein
MVVAVIVTDDWYREQMKLKAERDKLRAALEAIAEIEVDYDYDRICQAQEIARCALEGRGK